MIRIFVFWGVILFTSSFARAGLLAELSIEDQKKVQAGGQVIVTETLKGYPWPRMHIYQIVKATPREFIAVFTDYNNAHQFIPNCLKSKISKEISPLVVDVDYIIDIPILADEAYTVRDTLSKEADGSLQVKWKVIKATSIQESEGSILAEPYGKSECLIRYTNLVKPSSVAAPLLKGMATSQMKDTVDALVAQVEKLKADSDALRSNLNRLDVALGNR